MKIIDLLNRIAKDEGIPIKIKFRDKTWEWNSEFYDYRCEEDNHRYLVEDLETEDLNRMCEEIPIIGDKKKIGKMGRELNCVDDTIRGLVASVNEIYKEIADKINEIIDVINKGDSNV